MFNQPIYPVKPETARSLLQKTHLLHEASPSGTLALYMKIKANRGYFPQRSKCHVLEITGFNYYRGHIQEFVSFTSLRLM